MIKHTHLSVIVGFSYHLYFCIFLNNKCLSLYGKLQVMFAIHSCEKSNQQVELF